MTNRSDKPVEEYLSGNTPVSRAYRALPDDAPPAKLEAAILDKARVTVANQPTPELQRRRWQRMGVPVALAASLAMTVSIVLELSKQPLPMQSSELQPAPATSVPVATNAPPAMITGPLTAVESAPPDAAGQVAPLAAPEVKLRKEVDAQQRRERMELSGDEQPRNRLSDNTAATESVASPPPAAPARAADAPAMLRGNIVAARDARQQPRSVAQIAEVQAKAVATVPVAANSKLSDQVQRDPAKWLAAIQTLRTAGKTQEADHEWLAFRKAWPNYPVASTDASSSQSSQSE